MCVCSEGAHTEAGRLVVFGAVESGGILVSFRPSKLAPASGPLHLLLSLLRAVFPPDIHTAHSLMAFKSWLTCPFLRQPSLIHLFLQCNNYSPSTSTTLQTFFLFFSFMVLTTSSIHCLFIFVYLEIALKVDSRLT